MVVLNAFQAEIYERLIKTCLPFHSFYTFNEDALQNKISPNNGTLLNGVLIPKLLNSPFAS